MGLASKLAAAQANPGAYYGGAPPPGGGYPPQGGSYPPQGQPGQYPPPGGAGQYGQQPGAPKPGAQPGAPYQTPQYQAYSGSSQKPGQPGPQGAPYGQPQQGQYGAPQQSMGGPPVNPAVFTQILQQTVTDNKLQQMFPPGSPKLDQIARTITTQVDQLCNNWRVPREVGMDLVKLSLFDIIIYIDDSGSMAFEEGGERIKDLKLILQKVAYAATLFDQDGISLRFMNNDFAQNNIKTDAQINQVVDQINFRGLTPMGTALRNKVLDPLVLQPARANQLQKPVLVITITDGQPAGEAEGAVEEAVLYASTELSRTQYGAGAVSFQFAQVGNDLRAREFLAKLDKSPRVGHLIDCTSNYEVEADEMSKASPPVNLTVELWLTKLLLGAIDSSYDRKDETANHPQQHGGPSGYGAPPSQYGAPQGQYGAPPPGQYGGQQQYPPQGQPGQYGQQQGYPPQGQGQYGAPQGQYGAPPQQGQYGQQQQYGGQYGQQQGYPPRPH